MVIRRLRVCFWRQHGCFCGVANERMRSFSVENGQEGTARFASPPPPSGRYNNAYAPVDMAIGQTSTRTAESDEQEEDCLGDEPGCIRFKGKSVLLPTGAHAVYKVGKRPLHLSPQNLRLSRRAITGSRLPRFSM